AFFFNDSATPVIYTLSLHDALPIAAGGDVPPELTSEQLRKIPGILIARGSGDALYSEGQFGKDEARLRKSGVNVHTLHFSGGHEWPVEFGDPLGWLFS